MLVCDLYDGQELDQVLLIRVVEARTARDGERVLELTLGDRSGRVTATVRDDVAAAAEVCRPGRPVHVRARYEAGPRAAPRLAV